MSVKPEYVILLLFTTAVNYISGIGINNSKNKTEKKLFLSLSLIASLGLLIGFKYFNFFSESLTDVLSLVSMPMDPFLVNVILPVGISFYTFQALSYTIDIYRGRIKPEKHFGIFAVYVSFFPQLVAGPIERANNLLPQFFEKHYLDYKQITDGLKLMLWGFFKKIVIADRLAILVNTVYGAPTAYTGLPLILATVFFAFQIYCDFSGYSDIAIGAAQVLGFRLKMNFKRPYFAKSLTEFWKRWHISLTSWFKDYFYIPLGGNKVSVPRWYLNIFLVFLVSGLWHGASWTFVIWGALHGGYLLFEKISSGIRHEFVKFIGIIRFPRIHKLIQIIITFSIVNIGWIFFRAETLSDAIYILSNIFTNMNLNVLQLLQLNLGLNWAELIIAISSIIFMIAVQLIQSKKGVRQFLSEKPIILRWSVYLIIIFSILLFGVFNETDFIYFQF